MVGCRIETINLQDGTETVNPNMVQMTSQWVDMVVWMATEIGHTLTVFW